MATERKRGYDSAPREPNPCCGCIAKQPRRSWSRRCWPALSSSFARADRRSANGAGPEGTASGFLATSSFAHFKSAFLSRECDTFNTDEFCGKPNPGSGGFSRRPALQPHAAVARNRRLRRRPGIPDRPVGYRLVGRVARFRLPAGSTELYAFGFSLSPPAAGDRQSAGLWPGLFWVSRRAQVQTLEPEIRLLDLGRS